MALPHGSRGGRVGVEYHGSDGPLCGSVFIHGRERRVYHRGHLANTSTLQRLLCRLATDTGALSRSAVRLAVLLRLLDSARTAMALGLAVGEQDLLRYQHAHRVTDCLPCRGLRRDLVSRMSHATHRTIFQRRIQFVILPCRVIKGTSSWGDIYRALYIAR